MEMSCPIKAARGRGLGFLAMAGLMGGAFVLAASQEADAQGAYGYYRQGFFGFPSYEPYPELRPRSEPRPRPRQSIKPQNQPKEANLPPPPPGPHHLIVSVKSQRASLYSNGKLVMQSPVSTGTETHPTPYGVFSVIQKNRHHRSNIYSDAPMPYMQRLTWSGIALHEGRLPGYPASHGCIRLPEQFANFLWRTTKLGARVIVSHEDVELQDIAHAKLFQPKAEPATVEAKPELRKTLDTTPQDSVRTASMTAIVNDAQQTNTEPAKPIEQQPDHLTIAPQAESPSPAADIAKQETTTDDIVASTLSRQADIPDAILASFSQSLLAKQKMAAPSGAISVFVSRKDKRIYVRQGFHPLFTAPVTFRDETAILGTHVFTALDKGDGGKTLRWVAITMPAESPQSATATANYHIDAHSRPIKVMPAVQAKPVTAPAAPTAASVLDRIEMSQEVVDRVSDYVAVGASLIVSDHGIGYETGLYTDFIVVTR